MLDDFLAYYLPTMVMMVWSATGLARQGGSAPDWINNLYWEVRPLVPMFLVGGAAFALVVMGQETSAVTGHVFSIGMWMLGRKVFDGGDDDRWKRRKERLAEKVAQVGAKLTVVPADNPA